MPYALGGDPLEKVTTGVKSQLQPDEEKKLSGDMRELYDRLLPSADSDDRRGRFVQKLDRLLNKQWPGADIQIRVFGSSGNLLCTSDSDGQ
jgi:DNA polymerase sigma